jgi:hypothetical protein
MKSDDLQTAIYTRLNDSSVTSLLSTYYSPLVAIFSDVPQAADSELESAFPFITIGGDTINPFDSKDDLGGSAVVQIDVWDRATSMLDLKAVVDAVDNRLRRQPLSISGVTHITTELDSCNFSKDPDGKTKRALILYRVLWIA